MLLDDKWIPIIFLFKMLCLSQIFLAMTSINNHVHNAQGRPGWGMCYNAACALFMSISFYFAVQHGLNAIIIPWMTTFIFMCIIWITITIKKTATAGWGKPRIVRGKFASHLSDSFIFTVSFTPKCLPELYN